MSELSISELRAAAALRRSESEIGVDSCVSSNLPRQPEAEASVQAVACERVTQLQPQRETIHATILVVDDDDGIRTLLVEILGDLQYQVIEAADGHAAVRLLESGRAIDLLITDVGLPGINGREVARCGRRAHPDLKILMITGYGDNQLVRQQQLEPGTELMSKPFSLDLLTEQVGRMLAPHGEPSQASK